MLDEMEYLKNEPIQLRLVDSFEDKRFPFVRRSTFITDNTVLKVAFADAIIFGKP